MSHYQIDLWYYQMSKDTQCETCKMTGDAFLVRVNIKRKWYAVKWPFKNDYYLICRHCGKHQVMKEEGDVMPLLQNLPSKEGVKKHRDVTVADLDESMIMTYIDQDLLTFY